MKTTTHQCKYPYTHYNIDSHIEKKCQKLHRDLNLKNRKKYNKNNNNLMTIDSINQVKRNLNMNEKIDFKSV